MMGLMSHLSCISNAFSSYRAYFSSVAILTMTGLGFGHLVRALLHFTLEILLVVAVAEYLAFFFRLEWNQLVKW